EDLLAFSRSGRDLYPPERVDVAALVHNILELLTLPPGFVVEVSDSLPTILAERIPLAVVLRNLIGNALQHHPQPRKGRVQISAEDQGMMIRFVVADNGMGIDPQYHEHIFQMFEKMRSPRIP